MNRDDKCEIEVEEWQGARAMQTLNPQTEDPALAPPLATENAQRTWKNRQFRLPVPVTDNLEIF